jgi:hypothetical protein
MEMRKWLSPVLSIDYFILTEIPFLMCLLSILFFQLRKILKGYVRYIVQYRLACVVPVLWKEKEVNVKVTRFQG